ncbi:hypothetical protein [Enterovibrio coralii]|uniref:Uncharacterized protein n=1 Tax=Enterovibrio coralii TaxID=294935 RepID=A0A135I3L9_9GAMM|nr:hypothetical protein [Enterovibrio coralii]KXF80033.1 hypothetical protein ATN88_13450 [Enterovibrio coralii]
MIIKNVLAILILLFSFHVSASYINYFPGPAQAPRSANPNSDNSELFMNGNGYIVNLGAGTVEIGFNKYSPRGQEKHCSTDGKTFEKCVNNKDLRGDNAGLVLIKDSELDPREFPGEWDGSRDNLKPTDPKFKIVRVSQNLSLDSGVYHFGELVVGNGKSITVKGKVEIHVNQLHLNGSAKVNLNGVPENLTIWVHGGDGEVNDMPSVQLNYGSTVHGYIYTQAGVDFGGNNDVLGAVTANNIKMNQNSTITYSSLYADYKLVMTPKNTYSSSCSRVPITFQVMDKNGELLKDISGNLEATITRQQEHSCWAISPESTCFSSPAKVLLTEGSRTLWLQSDANNTVNVSAEFYSDKTGILREIGGRYRFAPVSFRVTPEPVKMVAGKPQFLSLEAVAATGGQCEVVGDYNGIKTLAIGETQYLSPNYVDGTEAPTSLEFLNVPLEKFKLVTFVDGLAKDAFEVRYADAGQLSFSLYEFDINEIDPALNQQDKAADEDNRVRGTAYLDVRPYTLLFVTPMRIKDIRLKMMHLPMQVPHSV